MPCTQAPAYVFPSVSMQAILVLACRCKCLCVGLSDAGKLVHKCGQTECTNNASSTTIIHQSPLECADGVHRSATDSTPCQVGPGEHNKANSVLMQQIMLKAPVGSYPRMLLMQQMARALAIVEPTLSRATPPTMVPITPVTTVMPPNLRSAPSGAILKTLAPALGPQ